MRDTYPHSGLVGWTCSVCNGWVGNGQAHYCPNSAPTKWMNPPPASTPTDARIADALERIAAALEATREAE